MCVFSVFLSLCVCVCLRVCLLVGLRRLVLRAEGRSPVLPFALCRSLLTSATTQHHRHIPIAGQAGVNESIVNNVIAQILRAFAMDFTTFVSFAPSIAAHVVQSEAVSHGVLLAQQR